MIMLKCRPTDPELWLARRARELGAGLSPLFHGTRYASKILDSGTLRWSEVGRQVVCFTKSPEAAAYWATIERDCDDGRGAIFIFDRDRLQHRAGSAASPGHEGSG
jgi:hypothetical protein